MRVTVRIIPAEGVKQAYTDYEDASGGITGLAKDGRTWACQHVGRAYQGPHDLVLIAVPPQGSAVLVAALANYFGQGDGVVDANGTMTFELTGLQPTIPAAMVEEASCPH